MPAIPPALKKIHEKLGIAPTFAKTRGLPFIPEWKGEIKRLDPKTTAHESFQILGPKAAAAWHKMARDAKKERIVLLCVSSFRTITRQKELIELRLIRGEKIDQILTYVAPPGYSQHHSASCIDISCPNVPEVLQGKFGTTKAFKWLTKNAARFGFYNTVGPNNPWGYINEPWHWYYKPTKEILAGAV